MDEIQVVDNKIRISKQVYDEYTSDDIQQKIDLGKTEIERLNQIIISSQDTITTLQAEVDKYIVWQTEAIAKGLIIP